MKLKSVFWEMLMTPALCALALPVCFLLLLHWSLVADHPSSRGEAYEAWETSSGSFAVRVTAYHEVGGNPFLPGAYIVHKSAPMGSDDWREFTQFHVNDTIRIPRDGVRFVSDGAGYVVTPSKYAATLDSGRSWFYWAPITSGPQGEQQHWIIRGVHVGADGKGEVSLSRYDATLKEMLLLDLHTGDFGQSWHEWKRVAKPNKRLQLTAAH